MNKKIYNLILQKQKKNLNGCQTYNIKDSVTFSAEWYSRSYQKQKISHRNN